MLGRVGDDASGAAMVAALTGSGADARYVRASAGVPTGTAVVMVRADGENSIVIVGGANTAEWGEDVDADAAITTAGMLLLQREVSDGVNARVAAIAAAAGVPVLLDAGGVDASPPDALLACVHTLSPNETELARLVGGSVDGDDDVAVEAAAASLLARGPTAVLVKRGSRGAMLVRRDGPTVTAPAFTLPRVVDTTGAGDCFTGAYAVAVLRGQAGANALRYAAAAAAVCVTREGAMPSLPSAGEVERVLKEGVGWLM